MAIHAINLIFDSQQSSTAAQFFKIYSFFVYYRVVMLSSTEVGSFFKIYHFFRPSVEADPLKPLVNYKAFSFHPALQNLL